jgi:hypothetical protein
MTARKETQEMTDIQLLALVMAIGFWWIGRKITGLRAIAITLSTPSSANLSGSIDSGVERLSGDIKDLSFAVARSTERRSK